MDADHTSTNCYRLQRSILFIGFGCTSVFVTFGVASTIAAYWNLDGSFAHPTRDALVYGIFWLCFALLGATLIAYHVRYRLHVSETEIEQIGLFFTKAMELSQVTGVRWRTIWRDVVLCAGKDRLRLEIDGLTNSDRREVIAFLLQRFDSRLHQGWPLFSKHCVAQQLRKEPMSWRRLSLGLFLAGLGTFLWFFLVVWLVGGDRQYLVIGVLLGIMLLSCLLLPATWRELRRRQVSEIR